jgi:PAS domain S-box-containing protein
MIYVSEEFETQTGYPPEKVLGRNCHFLQGSETNPEAVQAIQNALAVQTEITIDILNYRKDGRNSWNRLRIRPLFDHKGKLLYHVGAQNPISAEDVRPFSIDAIFESLTHYLRWNFMQHQRYFLCRIRSNLLFRSQEIFHRSRAWRADAHSVGGVIRPH